MNESHRIVRSDPPGLAREAAQWFVAAASEALTLHGRFTVALAGGNTPALLYRLLAETPYREQIDWQQTYVYFGDERCVLPDHPDSNYRMAREALLDRVPVPRAHIFRIMGELPPPEAADTYEHVLRSEFSVSPRSRPHFDLVLLGLGDDGHTASLFPGMPALEERKRLTVATAVPSYVRPAVPRVTLTLPVLNAARQIIFLVAGAAKAGAVRAVLVDPGQARPLPARRVRPRSGRTVWLLDQAAAAEIERRDDDIDTRTTGGASRN